MTNEEVIKKIKGICAKYREVENNCPFYNEEDGECGSCIFWLNGMPIPSEWGADNDL